MALFPSRSKERCRRASLTDRPIVWVVPILVRQWLWLWLWLSFLGQEVDGSVDPTVRSVESVRISPPRQGGGEQRPSQFRNVHFPVYETEGPVDAALRFLSQPNTHVTTTAPGSSLSSSSLVPYLEYDPRATRRHAVWTTVRFQQRVRGVDVYESDVDVTVSSTAVNFVVSRLQVGVCRNGMDRMGSKKNELDVTNVDDSNVNVNVTWKPQSSAKEIQASIGSYNKSIRHMDLKLVVYQAPLNDEVIEKMVDGYGYGKCRLAWQVDILSQGMTSKRMVIDDSSHDVLLEVDTSLVGPGAGREETTTTTTTTTSTMQWEEEDLARPMEDSGIESTELTATTTSATSTTTETETTTTTETETETTTETETETTTITGTTSTGSSLLQVFTIMICEIWNWFMKWLFPPWLGESLPPSSVVVDVDVVDVVPSLDPTPTPTPTSTSRSPTWVPSTVPSVSPTSVPTSVAVPVASTSRGPSVGVSWVPSGRSSGVPTLSEFPSVVPSSVPTVGPTEVPSVNPSRGPSVLPSKWPSVGPSGRPSVGFTDFPSRWGSSLPSKRPSKIPSTGPSTMPSFLPSWLPSFGPSLSPSNLPSRSPTNVPSLGPSHVPSTVPSHRPSSLPTEPPSWVPSPSPSDVPTTVPSPPPSSVPTRTATPSATPSQGPSTLPSAPPSRSPSQVPSLSSAPTRSLRPSLVPSSVPSSVPSVSSSSLPSLVPSLVPSHPPSLLSSSSPSRLPSFVPSLRPSFIPSTPPSSSPSFSPSSVPSLRPSPTHSKTPSLPPSTPPSTIPSVQPTMECRGYVYDPDPISTSHGTYGYGTTTGTGLVDDNDTTNPDLDNQRTLVGLLGVTFHINDNHGDNHDALDINDGNGNGNGTYRLKGPYAEIVDVSPPYHGLFAQPSPDFRYDRSQLAFEAVNCYYHVDAVLRYLDNTLGITIQPYQYSNTNTNGNTNGNGNAPAKCDPHALNGQDASAYISSQGWLLFGQGGVDDAEDASVIVHELGHAIHDWITVGGLSQKEGLSEGVSDYLAASYLRSKRLWNAHTDPQYHWLFLWDGHNEFWNGRTTNYAANYPDGLIGDVHKDGQIWATCFMKIWDQLGREKTDKAHWIGLSATNANTNQQVAANAIYQAAYHLGYDDSDLSVLLSTLRDDCGYDINADVCGDSVKGDTEECDGTDLGGAQCTDIGCTGTSRSRSRSRRSTPGNTGTGTGTPTPTCTNECTLDYSTCTPGADESLFRLVLTTDGAPKETSWTLTLHDDDPDRSILEPSPSSAVVVLQGGPYAQEYPHATYTVQACLVAAHCYTFRLNDDAYDGICCHSGHGNYDLFYGGIEILPTHGNFGHLAFHSLGPCGSTDRPIDRSIDR